MNHRKVITTGCCDKSNVHKVVKHLIEILTLTLNINKLNQFGLHWGLLYKEHIFESNVEVMYCPFCGVNVPEIEIK
jgi:hypothetical protein